LNQQIKGIKHELIEDIQNNIRCVDKSVNDMLKKHKWGSSKKWENDKILDKYSECLKDREYTSFFLKKIKASRSEKKIFDWLEECSFFFEKVEANIIALSDLIKKDS